MLLLIASATIVPSRAMTVPNGYSPLPAAMRDSPMQRAIMARSVASDEDCMRAALCFTRDPEDWQT